MNDLNPIPDYNPHPPVYPYPQQHQQHYPQPGYPPNYPTHHPPNYPPHTGQVAQPPWQAAPVRRNDRRRMTAALLALFLGGIGAHKFYLGKIDVGVVYLIFSFTLIPAFIGLIEFITYVTKTDEQFGREYNY